MSGIKILGVGKYLPTKIGTNADLAKIVDTSDEWIYTRTGMKERRFSSGEPTWFMAYEAGKNAIERAGIDPNEIDLIINATITGDFNTPSTACLVQRELGIGNAMAFDINAACTGFIYSLEVARNFLATGNYKCALVIGAENLTKIIDYTDRGSCILFGDGAGAAVVKIDDSKPYYSYLNADGNGAKHMVSRGRVPSNPFVDSVDKYDDGLPNSKEHYLFMDGREVYKFAIKAIPDAVNALLEKTDLKVEDIDFYIPHQANQRIIETAADKLGVPMEKFFLNIQKYGNTSGASIPLALCEAVEEGKIKKGDKVCLVGFGSGLTYGCILIEF